MIDDIPRLTEENLETYFRAAASTPHVLCDAPHCVLRIHPDTEMLELTAPLDGTLPDMAGKQRIQVDAVASDEGNEARLLIDATDMHYEAYALAVSIAQALKAGASFASATNASLSNFKEILAARRGLSQEQQVGLLGELMVVGRLLDRHAEGDVFEWWLGPAFEQHDFSFDHSDVEVKTTLDESRTHIIHGTDQLEPNPNRPLWLLSVQVTRGGGAEGVSLADLVLRIRGQLMARYEQFNRHLESLGWRDSDVDLYRQRYLLRSSSAAYQVDDSFPAITRARLKVAVPNADLVSVISYRIDVSTRIPSTTGTPIDEFVEDANLTSNRKARSE